MTEELENCPFCDSNDVWRHGQYDNYEDICAHCGATRKGKIHWGFWVKKPKEKKKQ